MLSQGGVSEAVELFDDGLGETFEGESFVMPWEVLRSCIGKPQGKVLTSSTISHGSRTVDVDRIGVFNRLWDKFACAFSSKVVKSGRRAQVAKRCASVHPLGTGAGVFHGYTTGDNS